MSNSNQTYPTAFRTNGQTVVNCAHEVELNRLAAMRGMVTPERVIVEKRMPTTPVKVNNGRAALFVNGYVENRLSKVLFPQ